MCLFLTSKLNQLFSDFKDFGSILGVPGDSKNMKKSTKIGLGTRLERVWDFAVI